MSDASRLNLLELMEVHINTLFRLDPAGRLRCVNEIGEPPAPLFYFGRTLAGNLWRFRHDLPDATVAELDHLCRSEPIAADLTRPPQHDVAMRALLQKHLALPQLSEYRGPAYWLPASELGTANMVLISEENAEVAAENFPWIIPLLPQPENGPVAAALEDGRAVSLCFCARRPGQATEAGLETVEGYRGKGYATAVVRAWAAAVRQMGCIPLYSTSWDNLASQAVARKLGAVCYGEDWSLR